MAASATGALGDLAASAARVIALATLLYGLGLFALPQLARIGTVSVAMRPVATCRAEAMPPSQRLQQPTSVVALADGRAHVVDLARGVLETWDLAACRPSAGVSLRALGANEVHALAADAAGNVAALDAGSSRLILLTPELRELRVVPLTGTGLFQPRGLAIEPDGSFLVANTGGGNIVRFRRDGAVVAEFGLRGNGPGRLQQPRSVVSDERGIVVGDAGTGFVHFFSHDGQFQQTFQPPIGVSEVGRGPTGHVFATAAAATTLLVLAPGARGFAPVIGPDGSALSTAGQALSVSPSGRVVVALPGYIAAFE
ncbi:MAG TPA: hypothetical protein VGL23_15805 [Chloroflexota bacterium]